MKPDSSLKALRFYWQQSQQYPVLVWSTLTALPFTVFINNYAPPLILAAILNKLSLHQYHSGKLWSDFGLYLVIYALISLFDGLGWRIIDGFIWRLEGNIERSMAQLTFGHLIDQDADFHANNFVGSLVSHTSKLLSAYIRIQDTTIFQVLPMLWGIIFVFFIMLPRAPLYSLSLLLFSIFYLVSAFFVTRKVRQLGAEVAESESRQTGTLADALTNVMAIKSFSHEAEERRRFKNNTDETYDILQKMAKASQRQMNFFGITTGGLEAVALLIAVLSVVSFHANIATAFLIFSYTSAISTQLFSFSNSSLRNYNRALGDANDMIETLAITPNVKDPIKPEPSRMKIGSIAFKNVTFTHSGADEAIFDTFNLEIKHGEKVGLVGHSGSGKTTFTRLLLRFSDVDSGSISINGQDIARVTQNDLHDAITYVPQEPLLFHRSVIENISYGHKSADKKAIVQAAEQAYAAEFIDTLPNGYETLVGERGVKLSGGQRQRIAIARALLKNAPILLLDEATSALDSESEVLIQAALWKLMEGRTAIIIAHRLSTIQKMDRIVVLDNGKIVEQGSHTQLLKKKGVYAKLWAHQSGGFMED
jgi:ATP-binding cassette subfamily B protein